jgi:pyruvate,water dikinase
MQFIKRFETVTIEDIPLVGGKNASLGEMIQHLAGKGVSIPSGFAITAEAYVLHLTENNLHEPIKKLLAGLTKTDLGALARVGEQIRNLIKNAPLPAPLVTEIKTAYKELSTRYGSAATDVAVRSSATAEDLPDASFAGQQDSYLNIHGEEALLTACRNCFASLFNNRAISYRVDHGFDHLQVALSVGVQKMVRSDKAVAGVIFTLDTESGFPEAVFITSSYGLGETVVQGAVNPDEFYVHKPTLKQGFAPILKKRLGSKTHRLVYTNDGSAATRDEEVPAADRMRFSLSNEEILSLARQALTIEEYYSTKNAAWCPMDIEWAKDGIDQQLYIVQARPETIHAKQVQTLQYEEFILDRQEQKNHRVLARGKSIGRKIISGPARIVTSTIHMNSIKPGDILVTEMTDPDWEPIMKIAAGIVTNRGGRTCHAAIVSRELGIPAIVGTSNATQSIMNGQIITLDCSSGEEGVIFDGKVLFELQKTLFTQLPKPPVEIYVNLGNPDEAFPVAHLPATGVGLARLEFIINSSIKIHPMALVHPEQVMDTETQKLINSITAEYTDKKAFFVDQLAQEAGTIAAAFYPRPVIIRLSDFKSNEYRQLIGGSFFEPEEENPMIGFRGASRYHHEKYQEAFALECRAMKKIREEMGLKNVILMIPFVRTVAEAQAVINTMAQHGLIRGENGLEVYMMCEIPANVLLIDQFSAIFDGFSIGSNDLTQMTLAVDRDSQLVANLFDERNDAVKIMLKMAIQGAKKAGKKIGICGQAPSDYPEVATFLIENGIDSISLTPDTIIKTLLALGNKKGLNS